MGFLDRLIVREPKITRSADANEEQLQKRASTLLDHELAQWIDNSVVATGRDVQNGLKNPDQSVEWFREAEIDALATLVLVRELRARRDT